MIKAWDEEAIDASVILAWHDNVPRLFEKKELITSLDLEKAIIFVDKLPILRDRATIDFSMPQYFTFAI